MQYLNQNKFSQLHPWAVSYEEAITIQKQLANKIQQITLSKSPRWIAAVDCAYAKDTDDCYAAAILWDLQEKKLMESRTVKTPCLFPYIPGLLSFREAPAMIEALSQLSQSPDVIIVDGQGIAHPRRLGIACHIGVITDIPTIGCGKSRLVGSFQEPGFNNGSKSVLFDKNEIIGTVLRTRTNVKPLFVSVGHKITLLEAEKIIIASTTKFRLPEPIRLADKIVKQAKIS